MSAPATTDEGTPTRTPSTPLVVKLLVAATFVVFLNETIMVNAIPRLMADFRIDAVAAQWLSTIFMLTMAAVIPITGWFLQRVTTRTAYATAMITFCAGTLLAAVAPAFEVLLVARGIQATGTAVMMPLLMTTLMTVVPEQDRGRVMGNVMLAMSCAPALGPAVSGVLLQLGSWRLIFLVVLPISAIVAIFGFRRLENVGEPQPGSIHWPSVLLATAGFATFVYGITEFAKGGVATPTVISVIGAVIVAVFVLVQLRLQRSGTPLMDLRTLTYKTFTVSLLVMTLAFMAFLGALILLPIYLQDQVRGLSALQTGLLVMPGGLAMGLLGPRVGRIYDRVGARPLVIPGAIGMLVTLTVFSQIATDTPYWAILITHVVLMISLACVFTPVFTLGMGALPQELYPHGSSILGTLQQVAGAVGTAVSVVIMQSRAEDLLADGLSERAAFVGGLQWAFITGMIFSALIIMAAFLLPSKTDAPAEHANH